MKIVELTYQGSGPRFAALFFLAIGCWLLANRGLRFAVRYLLSKL